MLGLFGAAVGFCANLSDLGLLKRERAKVDGNQSNTVPYLVSPVTPISSVPAISPTPPLSETQCQYPLTDRSDGELDTFCEPAGSHNLGRRSFVCLTNSVGALDLLRLKKNDAIGQRRPMVWISMKSERRCLHRLEPTATQRRQTQ